MNIEKLCACDRTCQSQICSEIELVDTVKQPFAVIVKNLSEIYENGLWLNPFRGIPRGPRLSRFDVIYLDGNCRVLAFVENFIEAEFKPYSGEAASALILPPHTLAAFQIRKSDQLRICRGKKVLAPLEKLAVSSVRERSQCVRDLGSRISQSHASLGQEPSPTRLRGESVADEEKPSFKMRLLRWLFGMPASTDRRRNERFPSPSLVAYYWTGGEPKAYQLRNVSLGGLYLLTEERWHPGTRIVMTLQKGSVSQVGPEKISRVESEVVRWGEDGIGFEFVQSGFVDLNTGEAIEDRKFDQDAFAEFLQSNSDAHQSTVH